MKEWRERGSRKAGYDGRRGGPHGEEKRRKMERRGVILQMSGRARETAN
jgi:hypothetical protein